MNDEKKKGNNKGNGVGGEDETKLPKIVNFPGNVGDKTFRSKKKETQIKQWSEEVEDFLEKIFNDNNGHIDLRISGDYDDETFDEIRDAIENELEYIEWQNQRKYAAIAKKKPTKLADYLNVLYTKDELLDLAMVKGIRDVRRQDRKAVIADVIAKRMLTYFRIVSYLLWTTPEEAETLRLIADSADGYSPDLEFDDMPHAFIAGHYVFAIDIDTWRMPTDVAATIKKVWDNEHFQANYYNYVWVRDCLELADYLYMLAPISVLLKIINQKPGFDMKKEQLIEVLRTQPYDVRVYSASERFVIHESNEPYIDELNHNFNKGSYYIPPLQVIESGIIVTPAARVIITNMCNYFASTCHTNIEVAQEFSWTIYEALARGREAEYVGDMAGKHPSVIDIRGAATRRRVEKRLRNFVEELDPLVRKVNNHGFTDLEVNAMAQAKANQKNNVVRLDDKRETKKKRPRKKNQK